MIAKYFATSLAIEKVVSAPRVIRSCLPISTISMSFVGSLSRSVAAHGDELALRLFVTNELQLRLRRRLGEKIIDPRLGCDRRRRQRIVAGDHHRPDAHPAQLAEALSDASLDDILQMDDAEQKAILRDGERRSARFPDTGCCC